MNEPKLTEAQLAVRERFGLIGDGVADETLAVQACVDAGFDPPPGIYLISDTIRVRSTP